MSSTWPLGALELKVLDLERQAGFYEWFGLTKLGGDEGSATFGAGGKPLLRLKVRVAGNGVGTVVVTDEGIGIAEEDQARLFSRFVRIETKATQSVSGTGLGLWLSREIARMHDGDLSVESTPGRGSTFTLRVPLSS